MATGLIIVITVSYNSYMSVVVDLNKIARIGDIEDIVAHVIKLRNLFTVQTLKVQY